ncbi:ubiquitin protein ligase protein, partial [Trichomonas vaginalis G3]
MIGLGAEIFDSEITRYIIDQGKIVGACNYNNTIQRNAESSFKLPPPKFEVTEKLKDTMKDIVHLIDLDTKDYYIAIQNCIILSFMTKVFENYPNKVELVDWSKTLKKLVSQTYQIQGIPNFSNSQFSFLIRQKLKRFTAIDKEVGIPNNDRFIPLTEYTSSNEEAIAGSPSTETFFVYTKQLENYEKIKFKLSKQTNTLKYIGFITDDWDTVFLSLFDMNIYSDKGFTKYTGSQSKVVLSIVDNYLLFGDVKVDSHALKKRWVFMITVCD